MKTLFTFAFILVAVIFISNKSFSQSFCNTPANIPDLLQTIPPSQFKVAASAYTVRIFIHIMRQTNGTGGQTMTEVNTAFNTLVADYQAHNICFLLLGIDEIKNDAFYNQTSFTSDGNGDGKFDNFSPNSNANAIDIYLFANNKLNSGQAANISATALVIGGSAFGINLASSHVLSHEMGHCLGLFHTFHGTVFCEPTGSCPELVNGSNGTTCGDFVQDTPADPKTFNFVSLSNCSWNGNPNCTGSTTDANGQSYIPNQNLLMAYNKPNCMQVHTAGQGTRMFNFLANSTVLQNVIFTGEDLYSKDTPVDLGTEPNSDTGPMWVSQDIWVRNQNDGLTNQVHQNPEHSATLPNFVYVRVQNKGCQPSLGTEQLKLYWSKASTGLSWPTDWVANFVGPIEFGNLVATATLPIIQPGSSAIIELQWLSPNPADFGETETHACLLARIETSPVAPFGMTFPETADVYANVQNNNNIVWKNVQVVNLVAGIIKQPCLIMRNVSGAAADIDLKIVTRQQTTQNDNFLNHGQIFLKLDEVLFQKWKKAGGLGESFRAGKKDFRIVNRGKERLIEMLNTDVTLHNFPMADRESHKVCINFAANENAGSFTVDAIQMIGTRLVGGVTYEINTRECLPIEQEWAQRFSGPDSLFDQAVAIGVDGCIYVTGASSSIASRRDYVTIKYDKQGNQQWAALFNGPANGDDIPTAIAIDPQCNVYVTGFTDINGLSDFATIKYDSSGAQQWITVSGTSNSRDGGTDITTDALGNVYVTGNSNELDGQLKDVTIKYNAAGVQQWAAKGSDHGGIAIGLDDKANVYITAGAYKTPTQSIRSIVDDIVTAKYNPSGVQQWRVRFNGTANNVDQPTGLAVDAQGNVTVTGFTNGFINADFVTIRYNTNGVQKWMQQFNGTSNANDEAAAIALDSKGNVIVTGKTGTSSPFSFVSDFATIQYNKNGELNWTKTFNGPDNGHDFATALAIDKNDNVYVAGSSTSIGSSSDYLTIKYSPLGEEQWLQNFNGSENGFDRVNDIGVDNEANVYVTGSSVATGAQPGLLRFELATIKYSQCSSQSPALRLAAPPEPDAQQTNPSASANITVYPNPNNGNMQVDYTLPDNQQGTFAIYNLIGVKVAEYPMQSESKHTLSITTGLSEGIYFYRVSSHPKGGHPQGENNQVIEHGKMVVIK